MNFPDDWQNYPVNGVPNPALGAWSSGLYNTSGQSSNTLINNMMPTQPTYAFSQHEIPRYQHPIILPPPQSEQQVNEAINQDNDQNRDAVWVEDQSHDQLQPKPAPLSEFPGSAFNKARHVYVSHVPKLMADEEIEQSRGFERYRLHSIRFELSQGDVLVFIDCPDYHKEAITHTDCNGLIYKSQQFRVHSKKLLETNSSAFEEMLRPAYQFRIQRRRKMVNKMPEGIKYVLDLTPPSEGDELVFQMTELSLTPALIKWWKSSTENDTDVSLVSGHDDVCLCNRQPMSPESDEREGDILSPGQGLTENSDRANTRLNRGNRSREKQLPGTNIETALQMKARGENESIPTPAYRRTPDYCPIRHRNGIIRLLMLIEGKGVIIDSAPRMWTLVKLGNIFDCSSLLRDRVTQWIMHGSNTTFVEVAPEEALQIAFSLKIPQIAESAFKILVNELALKLAGEAEPHQNYKYTTIFGRRLGNLPDELSNLVQHAAQALIGRVSDIDKMMRNPCLYDFWDIDEWNEMRVIEQLLARENSELAIEALAALHSLMDNLIAEVAHAWEIHISIPACQHLSYQSIDQDRLTYVAPQDFEKTTMIMCKFNSTQMLLCASPYNEVGVDLDARRWCSSRCRLAGYQHQTYSDLVQKATIAVSAFLASDPRLRDDELWMRTLELKDSAFPTRRDVSQFNRPIVSLPHLEAEVKDRLRLVTLSWERRNFEPPLNITRHLLLTLTDNELKYLPLWCGGCDDGTGGVFEDLIPSTDMGPKGPGPGFHTGQTIPSAPASISGSMIEDMDALRVWGSTTGASINVHDSISTVYRSDQVIAEDKSIVSESFTAGGSEYADVRFALPAGHQEMGEVVNMLVETIDESTDSESKSATEGRSAVGNSSDDDDDIYMWDGDSDSEGSTRTLS
ncbi:hypothetical protein FPOAC2_12160 [Fusarium poae]|uniref:Uncharacterized protein n=1 Tax=Fusarium poae TaxID=36050 RepID=A0A1B8AFL0_FUSPO|nr:hypothetical protein FPOAC1_011839 [Fusarium poae]KAG8667017.1 hypothetical protein FPOAC1_011839 [Fusarium poae]OBS19259.1 hypothetical protein FPOA_10983 [Fusarium poae]